MRTPRLLGAVAVPLVSFALLAGCGEETTTGTAEETPSPAASSAEPDATAADLPACGEVWVEGETLPKKYRGCLEGGEVVKPDAVFCEFGKRLVTYGDRFWAVDNGPVQETAGPLQDDRGYQRALSSCNA
jgi:hypothetical protein